MPIPQPDTADPLAPHRLRTARVIRVDEHACEVWSHGEVSSAGFAPMFPSPRAERVSPGHLVAIATGPDGTDLVVWRWYDTVVLGTEDDGSVTPREASYAAALARAEARRCLEDAKRFHEGHRSREIFESAAATYAAMARKLDLQAAGVTPLRRESG